MCIQTLFQSIYKYLLLAKKKEEIFKEKVCEYSKFSQKKQKTELELY